MWTWPYVFCQRRLYPCRVEPENTCITYVHPIQPSFDTKKKHMLWCRLWHPSDVGDILTRLQQTGWVGDGLWLLAEGTRSLVCFFCWCTVSCQQRPLLWDETRYLRALFASSLHPHDLSVLIWVQLCDRYKTCTEVLTNTFIPRFVDISVFISLFPKALNINQTYKIWNVIYWCPFANKYEFLVSM